MRNQLAIEVEKFHPLPSASWRPRGAGDTISVQFQRLEPEVSREEDRTSSSSNQVERNEFFLSLFSSTYALNSFNDAHSYGGGQRALLSPLTQTLISPGISPSQTHAEVIFSQISGHPVIQLRQHIKLVTAVHFRSDQRKSTNFTKQLRSLELRILSTKEPDVPKNRATHHSLDPN